MRTSPEHKIKPGRIAVGDLIAPRPRLHSGRVLTRQLTTARSRDTSSATRSPDGSRLASGGADRTVRLWDLDGHDPATVPGQPHTRRPGRPPTDVDPVALMAARRLMRGPAVARLLAATRDSLTPGRALRNIHQALALTRLRVPMHTLAGAMSPGHDASRVPERHTWR